MDFTREDNHSNPTKPPIDIPRINDVRESSEFKNISFSGYKRTEVRKQLVDCITKEKVEAACYWCAELVCAGHYMDIWEIFLLYIGRHIHLGNPKLPIYLEKRFQVFRNIMLQGVYYDELQLRNHNTIRELFAEIVCILASSPRKPSFDPIKINRVEEFDMTQMPERLKAPNVTFAEPILQKEDPKELWIAMNEFAFQISPYHSPNLMLACYWIEWIVDFDIICKKRKHRCVCERRPSIPVETKYQKEIIWLIWDALIYTCELKKNPFLVKLMDSIFQLFCIKFTPASSKRRRYLMYYAVSILTEPVVATVEIIGNKPLLETVIKKINTIYKQIKKNEQSPNLDYLYSGLDTNNNREKSMQKLELLGGMDPWSMGGGGGGGGSDDDF
jgi:hypothetical protein